jgi:hypothetical protein
MIKATIKTVQEAPVVQEPQVLQMLTQAPWGIIQMALDQAMTKITAWEMIKTALKAMGLGKGTDKAERAMDRVDRGMDLDKATPKDPQKVLS